MKPAIKLGSLLLAIMLVFTAVASGCSLNKEWSYKTSEKELPIGVYIYCLNNAYSTAKGYAEKLDDYDPTKDTWLDMEITDDDDNKAVARQWIKDKAEELCLTFLVVEEQFKAENATYDEATLISYQEQAKQYWEVGVEQYGQMVYAALSNTYAPYGVSLESFSYCYADTSIKQEALFYAAYGEGGSQEVKDDELEKHFIDNYVSYSYLSAPLYESTTDEAGESTSVALSDDEIKKVKSEFEGYVKQIKDGKSMDDVAESYKKNNGEDAGDPVSSTEAFDKLSMGDDFKEALEKLDSKKATTITVGEGNSAMLYFIYKDDIKSIAKNYLKDGEQHKAVLANMKSEDFQDYIKELIKSLKYEKNSAVDSYDPKMFFEPEEPATTEAADDSTADES